jgi:hypothetical protein
VGVFGASPHDICARRDHVPRRLTEILELLVGHFLEPRSQGVAVEVCELNGLHTVTPEELQPRRFYSVGESGKDMVSCRAMPGKKKVPEQDYAVGDRVKVNLHAGRIVDATVKAVIERTDGKRLQVDFGKDETAFVHLWQVVEKVR